MDKSVFALACMAAVPAWCQSLPVSDPLLAWLAAGSDARALSSIPAIDDAPGLLAALARADALAERAHGAHSVIVGEGGRFAVAGRAANGAMVGAGVGSMSGNFFGLSGAGMAPLALRAAGRFNAPYFEMVRDARHAGVSFPVGANGRVRVGLLTERERQVDVLPTWTPYAKRALLSVEVEQRAGAALAIASVGVLRESGALLGTLQGAGQAPGSARTNFASLSLGYALTPRLSLVGMASIGRTAGLDQTERLGVPQASFTTAAYSVGLSGRQLLSSGDRFGLTMTVPTKVTQGQTSYAGAALFREDGALSYTARNLNFSPSATERDWELSYSRPLDSNARIAGALMLRTHPGHHAGSPPELLIGVRYARRF